jgi:hypothetical protein
MYISITQGIFAAIGLWKCGEIRQKNNERLGAPSAGGQTLFAISMANFEPVRITAVSSR